MTQDAYLTTTPDKVLLDAFTQPQPNLQVLAFTKREDYDAYVKTLRTLEQASQSLREIDAVDVAQSLERKYIDHAHQFAKRIAEFALALEAANMHLHDIMMYSALGKFAYTSGKWDVTSPPDFDVPRSTICALGYYVNAALEKISRSETKEDEA